MKKILIIFILFSLATSLKAQPCLNDWQYRKAIDLTTTSASNLNNVQILFTVNTTQLIADSKLKTDGSDFRFLDDNGTELSYWINPNTINTASTRIWVRLNLTASSTTRIYMFYGNSSAVAKTNGTSTFVHFDDFNGNTIDNTKWNTNSNGTISVANGTATFTTTAGQQALIEIKSSWNASSAPLITEVNAVSSTGGLFIGQYLSNKSGYGFYYDGTNTFIDKTTNGSPYISQTNIGGAYTPTGNFPDICSISWFSTGHQKMEGIGTSATTTNSDINIGIIKSTIGNTTVAGTTEIDWFRTRKYIATADLPNIVYSAEEVIPTSSALQITSNSPLCEGETLTLSVDDIASNYNWNPGSSNTNTLTITNTTPLNSGTYTVTVYSSTSGCGEIVSTTEVLVSPTTNKGIITGDNQVCEGINDSYVVLNSYVGDIVRWEYSNTGSVPWASISETNDSLHYVNLLQNTYYRAVVKSGTCSQKITDSVLVQVDPTTQGGILYGDAEHCYGSNNGLINLSASEGSILKWQSTTDNTNWIDIANTTNQLSYNNITDTTSYRAIVKSGVCANDTSTLSQIIINPLPNVNFISDTVSLGNSTHFTNQTTIVGGNISTYNWDFTTGEGSQVTNPVYEFSTADTFQVLLVATSNKNCVDSIRKNVIVKNIPQIDFTFSNTCANDTVFFTNQTNFNGTVYYLWSFGDGTSSTSVNPNHTYTSEGTYSVKLIVSSSVNTDSITKQIIIYPRAIPNFSAQNVCTGEQMIFLNNTTVSSGGVTYNWNFGDGNTNTSLNPQHLYAHSGSYNVELIATTNFACKDTIVKTVTANKQPVAYFKFNAICSGFPVQFTDSSSYLSTGLIDTTITDYSWSFGDGSTSTIVNPIHSYSTPGTYIVTLSLTSDSGCVSTYTSSLESYPNPIADFSVNDGCYGFTTEFTNQSTIISGSFSSNWDFGDSNTSTQTNPENLYNSAGTYNVRLIVESNHNCTDTITKTVAIYANPVADFSADNVCDGEPTVFVNNTTTADTTVSIVLNNWDFGNGTNSIQENPTTQYLNPGTYNVSLIVTASNNCKDTIVKPVIVDYIPNAAFTVDNVCDKIEAEFFNASTIDNSSILSYQWTFGDGDSSVVTNPKHLFSQNGTYTVKLKVLSPNNCADSVYHEVTVYKLPEANAGTDTSISLGYSTILQASGGINYFWNPFNSLDDAYSATPTAKPTETTVYIVKVTDNNSCENTDTVIVEVINDFNLIINNVITPDGNGQNDVWIINNIENYDDNKVVVFDRWGNEVYVEEAYKNTWNGVNKNGDILPDGTYYYYISSESVEKIYKGAITILRNK